MTAESVMPDRTYNVLFLCTGNSCRSIIAECLLNQLGRDRHKGYSAGSHPAGRVNPSAIRALQNRGFPSDGLRSKSWDEFEAANAPVMDVIITVCNNAAGESCPVWPGQPVSAHWGLADPSSVHRQRRRNGCRVRCHPEPPGTVDPGFSGHAERRMERGRLEPSAEYYASLRIGA